MIAFKAYKDKSHKEIRLNIVCQIQRLEKEAERAPTGENVNKLSAACNKVKIIEAQGIAKDILHDKQRQFDFSDKPGKQLTWVLSEKTPR